MVARAESARENASRIADAALEAFWERPTDQLSLDAVAARAGVSKQTVLRHFGSKAGLLAAAAERGFARIRDERGNVAPGDVDSAVAALVAHYERVGEGVVRMLAEEHRVPALAALADQGRAYHADWCAHVFAPALTPLRGAERRRRLALLVAATDVHTWHLLRHTRGLSRRETERALRELLHPHAGGTP